MSIDLRKSMVIDLKKKTGLDGQKATVVAVLDVSPSMGNLYSNGSMQSLTERLLALGLAFDDDGKIDMYGFSTGYFKAPDVSVDGVAGYVNRHIASKINGGTNYAPVVNAIKSEFAKTSGWLVKKATTLDYPVFVIFITDGDNNDKPDTVEAITKASQHGIFFQFVGIGKERFSFLEKLDNLTGRNIDNCGFFKVDNLSNITDAKLYESLLVEFPSFVKEARNKGLIK
jgi:hypothetical protein